MERDCIHCCDCIAYALIASEELKLELPRGAPYMVVEPSHHWAFVKFLGSTISRDYLPCGRALCYEDVKDFAWSLPRLPVEVRRQLRSTLAAHTEFKARAYTGGVKVLRGKPFKGVQATRVVGVGEETYRPLEEYMRRVRARSLDEAVHEAVLLALRAGPGPAAQAPGAVKAEGSSLLHSHPPADVGPRDHV
jgi:hypothetical protein